MQDTMTIIISLIWGFGIVMLFRKVCINDQCYINKVPKKFIDNSSIIKDKNNQQYQLTKYQTICD